MKKIVVLGDSHSQLFANDESLGRGTKHIGDSVEIKQNLLI